MPVALCEMPSGCLALPRRAVGKKPLRGCWANDTSEAMQGRGPALLCKAMILRTAGFSPPQSIRLIKRSWTDETQHSQAGQAPGAPWDPSIHVALVALVLLELGDEGGGVFFGKLAVLFGHAVEGGIDILGHARGIP